MTKPFSTTLPVLFSSCTEEMKAEPDGNSIPVKVIYPGNTKAPESDHLDIFTFNDDQLRFLDSFQRAEGMTEGRMDIRSQNGNKIIFACANIRKDIYDWSFINSFEALEEVEINLKDERRQVPVMTGIGYAEAGQEIPCNIEIHPLASEIWLRSLACDFSPISEYGTYLHDIKVYLTNVNAISGLNSSDIDKPKEIINHGKLDMEDIHEMAEPDLVFQEIDTPVGRIPYKTDIRFLCYPNTSSEEGPGTPFTRLVIEGKIDGETYWWPVNINREQGIKEPGIHRNCRYVYDIIIRRKGNKDSDTAIEMETAYINLETKQWNEKDNYTVGF